MEGMREVGTSSEFLAATLAAQFITDVLLLGFLV